jgi:hypothetical protein
LVGEEFTGGNILSSSANIVKTFTAVTYDGAKIRYLGITH